MVTKEGEIEKCHLKTILEFMLYTNEITEAQAVELNQWMMWVPELNDRPKEEEPIVDYWDGFIDGLKTPDQDQA